MADTKISAFPAVTTPVSTDVLPVVQAGADKKATLAQLQSLPSDSVITDATTTRTLGATDNGRVIYFTSGSAITCNMATGLGAGFSCIVVQGGAGQVTFAANGTTMNSQGGFTKTNGQYAVAQVLEVATDVIILGGNLA